MPNSATRLSAAMANSVPRGDSVGAGAGLKGRVSAR